MANFLTDLGGVLSATAEGIKDPGAQARREQEMQAKQQAAKLSAYQIVLQNPDAPEAARQAAIAGMEEFGLGAVAAGMTPAAKVPKRNIRQVGNQLVDIPQEGDPEVIFTGQPKEPKEERPRFQSLTAVQRGTGATMRARFNPLSGQTTDEAGNLLGPDWVTTKATISAPTPGSITETQQGKSEVQLRQNRIATLQALNTSDRMIDLVDKNPAAFTTGANIAGFVDTLGTATQSMLFALGVDTALSQANPLDYPDEFWGPLINASDEGKQLAFVLALQLAAATGLGEGRALTDRDVQRAIRLVGTDVQSPERVKARLRSNQRTLMEHHNISRNIILGPGNDIFQDRLKEFGDTGGEPPLTDEQLLQSIQEQLQQLTPRQ